MSATTLETTASLAHGRRVAVEWPTLLLAMATYGAWLAVTLQYGRWPLWVLAPVCAVLVTLHSSLQHEIVHGHPTRWRAINSLLGKIPLALWLPFARYRDTHLAHHVNDRLTDPGDDPESYYWNPEAWARLNAVSRWAIGAQQTLAGRVVLGSFWRIGHFLRVESLLLRRGRGRVRAQWLEHLLWCIPVVVWLKRECGMPLWLYVVAIVIPSNGLLLIRSFAEHRANAATARRTAIVENSWVLGPLYLFNNLHALHHEEPLLPWYDYHARYRAVRSALIAANGGLLYESYLDVARRYLFRAHDVVEHPTGGVPRNRSR